MAEQAILILDIETTGLEPTTDLILQIGIKAFAVPFGKQVLQYDPGKEITIHYDNLDITQYNEFVQKTHRESGLFDRVANSTISLAEAEEQIIAYIKDSGIEPKPPMCGNSIHFDRAFLKQHMPTLESLFHYRNLDLTSVKLFLELAGHTIKAPRKGAHTALDDIQDSANLCAAMLRKVTCG